MVSKHKTEMTLIVNWEMRISFGIAPMNKLISRTWLLLALRSFRRFTLHVQCTSSTNHWLVPSVKNIEPVVANDMVIRKPRFHRQTGPELNRQGLHHGPARKALER